jgi:DnaJ-class molecular chaperone
VFVKPIVPEPPPAYMDKGKAVIGGEGQVNAEIIKQPPTKRSPPICHHCGVSGHIQPRCPQQQGHKKLSRHAPLRIRPPARY